MLPYNHLLSTHWSLGLETRVKRHDPCPGRRSARSCNYTSCMITSVFHLSKVATIDHRTVSTFIFVNMRSLWQRPLCRPIVHPRRSYHASVLPSLISTSSPEFKAKTTAMDELVQDLEEKVSVARQGGSAMAVERMRSKGKLLPRERLATSICSTFIYTDDLHIMQTESVTGPWFTLSRAFTACSPCGIFRTNTWSWSHYWHRPHIRTRVRHCRERCDGKRWLILSTNCEEASASTRDCEGEWASLHLCR